MRSMTSQQLFGERRLILVAGTGPDEKRYVDLTLRQEGGSRISIHINEGPGFEPPEKPPLDIIDRNHLIDSRLMKTEKCLKDMVMETMLSPTSRDLFLEALKRNTHWQTICELGEGQEAWHMLQEALGKQITAQNALPPPQGVVYITGGKNLKLGSVGQFVQWIQETVGQETSLLIGCTLHEGWENKVEAFLMLAEGEPQCRHLSHESNVTLSTGNNGKGYTHEQSNNQL